MDRKTPGITNIGDMIVKLQSINKPTPGFLAASKFEPDEAAEMAIQVPVCALAMNALLQRGINYPRHFSSLEQKIDYSLRIFAVLLHAQHKRLETLNDEEGIKGRKRGTDIAKERDPGLDRIGNGAERFDRFRPDRSVVAGIGGIERRLSLGVRRPVEITAINNQAADRVSMPAEIFRRGIHDDRGTVLKRPYKEWRRRIVNDERNAERAAYSRYFGNREDRQFRIWESFGIVSARPFISRTLKILRVNRVDKTNLDSLIFEGMCK